MLSGNGMSLSSVHTPCALSFIYANVSMSGMIAFVHRLVLVQRALANEVWGMLQVQIGHVAIVVDKSAGNTNGAQVSCTIAT